MNNKKEYPPKTYKNRLMTDAELSLRKDKRCIICGAKVKISITMIDGKPNERWPAECSDCHKQTGTLTNFDGYTFEVHKRDIHNPYKRILGYNPKDEI